MARYIDADALIEDFTYCGADEGLIKAVIQRINLNPTADVVPKSEVDRLRNHINRLKKYDEERDIALHARLIAETRKKVAREIFEEIEEVLNEIGYFDEIDFRYLKKKYTESEDKG